MSKIIHLLHKKLQIYYLSVHANRTDNKRYAIIYICYVVKKQTQKSPAQLKSVEISLLTSPTNKLPVLANYTMLIASRFSVPSLPLVAAQNPNHMSLCNFLEANLVLFPFIVFLHNLCLLCYSHSISHGQDEKQELTSQTGRYVFPFLDWLMLLSDHCKLLCILRLWWKIDVLNWHGRCF